MGNPLLFQLNMLTFKPQGECLSLPRFFGGFGLHGSTIDLCNLRGHNTLQSSWNLLRNQSWADMSVSNGWNSPLLDFGGGMSYMDTFSYQGPNIPLLLLNACYQANNMYAGLGATPGTVAGALAPGVLCQTPGVVTPGSNGPSDLTPKEENAKRHYENLKSLLNSYKALSDSLSSEDTDIEVAIKTADAKTTYVEKLTTLVASFDTYKDSILSKIGSGDITVSGVDLSKLGIIFNTNLRSSLGTLKDYINKAGESTGDSKDTNIKGIEDLLATTSAFPILDVISSYNAQYPSSNIFNIDDDEIIEVFADKLLAKAGEIEKDAQSLLSNESLQSFKEAIEDLESSKTSDNLKELYKQSRLILAMLEDRKFVDNYGTAMGNTPLTTLVLKQLRDELGDSNLGNPIKMKGVTTTGAEEVSGAEDAGNEDGNNDDNIPEKRDYSEENNEIAKGLLRCSFYSKAKDNDDGSILIKYNNKTADSGNDDTYYLIKDNKIYKSNANGSLTADAKAIDEDNLPVTKKAIDKMYQFNDSSKISDIKGFENYNKQYAYKSLQSYWPSGWENAIGTNHKAHKISEEINVEGLIEDGYSKEIIEEAKERFDALYDGIQKLIRKNGPRKKSGSDVYELVDDSGKTIKHSMFRYADNDNFTEQKTKKRANTQKEAYDANNDDNVIISGIITYTDSNGEQFTGWTCTHRQYYSEYVVLHNFIDIVKEVAKEYADGNWSPS